MQIYVKYVADSGTKVLKVETYGGGIVVPEGAREKYARTFGSFWINQQEITR